MTRRMREAVAWLLLPIGLVGLILWGVGAVLTIAGRSLWMFAHKICRNDDCTCDECRDFDPEFVRAHQGTPLPTAASEPPAAA